MYGIQIQSSDVSKRRDELLKVEKRPEAAFPDTKVDDGRERGGEREERVV